MDAALEMYAAADTVIWATPVYHFGMTAHMKKFIERTLPMSYPYMVLIDGLYHHPPRCPLPEGRKDLLFSTCGFPDDDNFRVLQAHFEKLLGRSLAYSFFLAEGELLSQHALRERTAPILEHLRQAGSQWAAMGKIGTEHLESLRQPIVSVSTFVNLANMSWNAPGETPPTAEQVQNGKPYPLAVRPAPAAEANGMNANPAATEERKALQLITQMAAAFNPARATGVKALLELSFTDIKETYQLRIEAGRCSMLQGAQAKPTTRIVSEFETWKSISEGRLNGQQALFDGLYRVEGDFSFMMRMAEGMFKGAPADSSENALQARKSGNKKRNLMFVAFIPWYLGWYLNGLSPLVWIAFPLLFAIGFLIWRERRGEGTWFERGTALCFAILAGLFLATPSDVGHFAGALCNLMIGAVWGSSLLVGKPLTQEYSKNNYSESIASSALFLRINTILTVFWTVLFAGEAAVGFAVSRVDHLGLILSLAMLPALAFTLVFPQRYVARLARKGGPKTVCEKVT
jgi:putative sterol carrier protein